MSKFQNTTKLVCTRTQRKGAESPQETEPDLPVSVQESPAEVWVDSCLSQGQRHWLQQSWELGLWHKSFWRRSPLPHHSLASGQTTGREHSLTHRKITGLKIYWAWPCAPEQDPVLPIASASHQEISTSFISSSIRGQTLITKTNQMNHMDHNLVWHNELWAMPCRATQDGWVMVRVLTKRGPLEKGMESHFSILALTTPGRVWKGKKIWH